VKLGTNAHSRIEEETADRYRKAGYEVFLQPKPALVPFDLGGYRPDIIARKGELNLIIEVKSEPFVKSSYERLRGVVEETRRHEGWRFVLVTDRDLVECELPNEHDQFSWEEIDKGIKDADKLELGGEHQAAYLILWIAFERTIRKLSVEANLPLERFAPAIMIRQLYSEGVLSMAQFDIALICLEFRNRVVHGFQVGSISGEYERLRELISELLPKNG
jgi:Holliday junction resolvase